MWKNVSKTKGAELASDGTGIFKQTFIVSYSYAQ